jgi:two-component system, NtrC family, sensor kinase
MENPMDKKSEMIEMLTGVRSSRKNYYVELTEMVQEMQSKNKQLEVMNQLTRIHVNMSWKEVIEYIASQLHQVISFDHLVLSILEGSYLSFFITEFQQNQVSTRQIHRSWKEGQKLTKPKLKELLKEEFPHHHMISALLQSHTDHTFCFLTMLHHTPYKPDESHFFKGMSDYVGIAIENILLYQDVCEKMKIEAQLIQSAKLAAIGEMAAGVAHELNSPLTAILGNTQLLLRELTNERAQHMLKDVYQCGLRSKKIIQNLLTFSRQDEYRFEELDVHHLIEDVCNLIGYQLNVSGIQIEKQLTLSLPLVKGSRYQIEQVLVNLLLNARDALQQQEKPFIRLETELVEQESQTYVGLSVYDNGTGIKPEHLTNIFNPFFTTKENLKGTGLGLSVSLGIAESHKGKIVAESKEGEYSRFTLLLPIPQDEEMD